MRENDWYWEWDKYSFTDEVSLFRGWIYPTKLPDFKGRTVLDCGCGGGQHLSIIAKYCKEAIGIDLNTARIAAKNTRKYRNIKIMKGDLLNISLKRKFDIVYSIGVLHHTSDPEKAFENIKKLCKKNGRLIIGVYSYESNFLGRLILANLQKPLLRIGKDNLWFIAKMVTRALYVPAYSIYLLPLPLPYYDYFRLFFRRVDFKRKTFSVFDKLNAPITHFIKRKDLERWFNDKEFKNVHISSFMGGGYRASGELL